MESFLSTLWALWPCRTTLQVTWSNSGLLSGKEHTPGAGLAGSFGICQVEVTLQLKAAKTGSARLYICCPSEQQA